MIFYKPLLPSKFESGRLWKTQGVSITTKPESSRHWALPHSGTAGAVRVKQPCCSSKVISLLPPTLALTNQKTTTHSPPAIQAKVLARGGESATRHCRSTWPSESQRSTCWQVHREQEAWCWWAPRPRSHGRTGRWCGRWRTFPRKQCSSDTCAPTEAGPVIDRYFKWHTAQMSDMARASAALL